MSLKIRESVARGAISLPRVILAEHVARLLGVQTRTINRWADRWLAASVEQGEPDLASAPRTGLRSTTMPNGARLVHELDYGELLVNATRESLGLPPICWRFGEGVGEIEAQVGPPEGPEVRLLDRKGVGRLIGGRGKRCVQEWQFRWRDLARATGDHLMPSSFEHGLRFIHLGGTLVLTDERDVNECLHNGERERLGQPLLNWRRGTEWTAGQGQSVGEELPQTTGEAA